MSPPKRNPTKADEQKTTQWAISMLNSVNAGYKGFSAGVAIFDLVNRAAIRAHRLTLVGGGKGVKLPVGGTFKRSPYGYFETTKLAAFKDFDGVFMEVEKTSAVVWAKFHIKIRESASPTSAILAEAEMSGRALGTPEFKGKQYGITEVLYTDGRPVGVPQMSPPDIKLPPYPIKPDQKWVGKPHRLPADVLFDFDSATLKKVNTGDYYGGGVLDQVGLMFDDMRANEPPTDWNARVEITGFTDSIGSREYNQNLSERRAEAVAKWFVDHKYLAANEVRAYGMGEDHPRAPNQTPDGRDNPWGREQNRSVEILIRW